MTDKPRRLATYVHVAGRRWGPGDDVPADVAAKITNPKVWAAPGDDTDSGPSGQVQQERRGGTRTGARLATYVHVGGRRYGPDDRVPDRVAARITNPKAWEGGVLPALAGGGDSGVTADNPPTPHQAPAATAGGGPAEQMGVTPGEVPQKAEDATPSAGDDSERMAVPPRSGRGSGLDVWQAFAVDHDVEFPDGASRDDIIAACVQARVIPAE